jgi:hypothetical protein
LRFLRQYLVPLRPLHEMMGYGLSLPALSSCGSGIARLKSLGAIGIEVDDALAIAGQRRARS